MQPQQYLVLTDPDRRAMVGNWYLRAFDRYEHTLPDPTEFRDDDGRRSWERTRAASPSTRRASRPGPVIVIFLQPVIRGGPATRKVRSTSGASTPPCTRRCKTSRGSAFARAGHDAHDRHPHLRRRSARRARRTAGQVRDRGARSGGSPDWRVRRRAGSRLRP